MSVSISSPLVLPCGVTVPNRFGKSAMTEGLANELDQPTSKHNTLYERWADGGTGILITGNVMVDHRYLERAGNVVLEDESALDLFKAWALAGTRNNNHLWMQISHPGRQCAKLVNKQPMAPSAVQLDLAGQFGTPKAMTDADIEDVINRFVTTATLAKKAGFTGVQIHCAHGYLVSEFLNPLVNKRTDQWGGSLENRARFARTIVQRVRKAVGPEFPISAKLNSSDFQKGGFTVEECIQVAQWLGEDSVDLLEISGGNYEQLSLMGIESTEVRESTRRREAYFIEYASAIKAAAKCPIMVTGGFRSIDVMQRVLGDGETDIIGLARPLCTQPDAPNQLIAGELEQLDEFEQSLVLGKGFWGHNTPNVLVKAINGFGAVAFFYRQIILLSDGKQPNKSLGVLGSFLFHTINDLRLNRRRVNKQQ